MVFTLKTFSQLTTTELYGILRLRSEVFVVEQECVYQDMDGKDPVAKHLFTLDQEGEVVAYCRIFGPDEYFKEPSIGRVVVSPLYRKRNIGKELMQEAIIRTHQLYPTQSITLSAQTYLLKFYKDLGFKPTGEEYLEDNIPHIRMYLYAE